MANTVNRETDVMVVLRAYWIACRIVRDTVHLQLLIRCYAPFVNPA